MKLAIPYDFNSFALMIPKLKRFQSSIDANMVSKELSKNQFGTKTTDQGILLILIYLSYNPQMIYDKKLLRLKIINANLIQNGLDVNDLLMSDKKYKNIYTRLTEVNKIRSCHQSNFSLFEVLCCFCALNHQGIPKSNLPCTVYLSLEQL